MAAAELVRVCAPRGVIGLCNWTPEGKVGELFEIMSRYLPPAPAFASPPPLWGSEDHVHGLFADSGVELEFERTTTPFRFDSAEHYASFFETNYGPMVKARERLTAEGRWDDCRSEIVEMMERRNVAADGKLDVPGEYLLVVGEEGRLALTCGASTGRRAALPSARAERSEPAAAPAEQPWAGVPAGRS